MHHAPPCCAVSAPQVVPVLVINKLDRLISELRLTPQEAYERMKRLVREARAAPLRAQRRPSATALPADAHASNARCRARAGPRGQANGVVSGFASEKFLSDADAYIAASAAAADGAGDGEGGNGEEDEELTAEATAAAAAEDRRLADEARTRLQTAPFVSHRRIGSTPHCTLARTQAVDVFLPDRGSVAFASAADGWAFRPAQFAALYAEKLGCSARVLERALWGDWCAAAQLHGL